MSNNSMIEFFSSLTDGTRAVMNILGGFAIGMLPANFSTLTTVLLMIFGISIIILSSIGLGVQMGRQYEISIQRTAAESNKEEVS